jgi:hypothetical protein
MKSQKQVSSKSLISYHRRWRKSKGLHFTDPILSARHILCNDDLQHSLRARRNWNNFNTTLFSKTLSRGREALIAGWVFCDAVYQTTRRNMPVTTVTTTPCTSHSGTDTSLCAFQHNCLYYGDVWIHNCCELDRLSCGILCMYTCAGVRCGGAQSARSCTQSVPCTSLMSNLILSFVPPYRPSKRTFPTLNGFLATTEWCVCSVARERYIIVGSNPTNSGHASKPDIFKFPPLKMCGLWSYWGIDFSVVVVVVVLTL